MTTRTVEQIEADIRAARNAQAVAEMKIRAAQRAETKARADRKEARGAVLAESTAKRDATANVSRLSRELAQAKDRDDMHALLERFGLHRPAGAPAAPRVVDTRRFNTHQFFSPGRPPLNTRPLGLDVTPPARRSAIDNVMRAASGGTSDWKAVGKMSSYTLGGELVVLNPPATVYLRPASDDGGVPTVVASTDGPPR